VAKKTTISEAREQKGRRKADAASDPAKSSPSPGKTTKSETTKRPAAVAPAKATSKATSRTSTRSKLAGSTAKEAAPAKKKAATKKATRAAAGPAKKTPTAARTRGGDGQAPKRPRKLRKTHLKPEDLQEFREMLIAKRRELVGDVTTLENEAMRHNDSGGGSSSMPIHMADLGSDTWEQELALGLIANERELLREIDEALDRIEDKTYGICLATNRPISKSRLQAKPWAKYGIAYARKRELGLV